MVFHNVDFEDDVLRRNLTPKSAGNMHWKMFSETSKMESELRGFDIFTVFYRFEIDRSFPIGGKHRFPTDYDDAQYIKIRGKRRSFVF